jgi:hypothetical protein
MLSDQVRQLLAAYVDGDLPAEQRQSALRLLEKSAEAQEFVYQLQADAAALRRLPRRQLGPEFAEKVLAMIEESWIVDPRHRGPIRTSVYPAWIGLGVAASVLLVVGVYAAVHFYILPQEEKRAVVVKSLIQPARPSDTVPKQKDSSPVLAKEKPAQPDSGFPKIEENAQEPVAAAKPTVLEFTAEADIAIATEPTRRFEVFKELDQAGGFSLKLTLRELDQPLFQERLKETLKDDKAFHLDLTCPSTAKGLDRLQTVFQAKGVKLLIDKAALTRWKKGLKTHYALYSEDLTPEELTDILQALGADDKKASPEQRFNKVVINHLGSANRSEICTLLGVDPRTVTAKPKGPLGVDLTQPLSKKTEEQLADSLAGKRTPRPEPGKAAVPKGPDRLALVLSYNPVRVSPASSKEIKQFLATRPGQRPGDVQILLVLRGS